LHGHCVLCSNWPANTDVFLAISGSQLSQLETSKRWKYNLQVGSPFESHAQVTKSQGKPACSLPQISLQLEASNTVKTCTIYYLAQ